jgi:hypothetical protein
MSEKVFDDLVYRPTSLNVNVKRESPTWRLRWIVKKDGRRVLQQLYLVSNSLLEPNEDEWRDIQEVQEG